MLTGCVGVSLDGMRRMLGSRSAIFRRCVFLLAGALQLASAAGGRVPEDITIHFVPHSHLDPGWRTTTDVYYEQRVLPILHLTVDHLCRYPNATFVWADIFFLWKWFHDSSFANGGGAKPVASPWPYHAERGHSCLEQDVRRIRDVDQKRESKNPLRNHDVLRFLIHSGRLDLVHGGLGAG